MAGIGDTTPMTDMTPTPANPENVPIDKIPEGWRLIYEHELQSNVPTRLWEGEEDDGEFDPPLMTPECRISDYTYITPDLPDNGQPWHAHNPGDPAPVGKDVKTDVVWRNGNIVRGALKTDWSSNPPNEADILFYRLHNPAPKHPSTFEAHGHTWFRHTPGDPRPCDKDALVHWINANELDESYYVHQTSTAGELGWKSQVGWRYATPEQPAKPHDSSISDRILDLLIVAGHVTAERVEQARKLAQM
jgi:hypothetical protein